MGGIHDSFIRDADVVVSSLLLMENLYFSFIAEEETRRI